MALLQKNTKTRLTYGGQVIGYDTGSGVSAPNGVFIDSGQKPLRWERSGDRFSFECQLVVSETTEANFNSRCTLIENAFDQNQKPSLGLRLETDAQRIEWFCPVGGGALAVTSYAGLGGRTVTVTVNATATVLTEGVQWTAATSNAATALSIAAAINASAAGASVVASAGVHQGVQYVYIDPLYVTVFSVTVATNASGANAAAASIGITGFNAKPSIRKGGTLRTDRILSRRYDVSVELQIAPSITGRNGRVDTLVQIDQSDSKRRRMRISGTYKGNGTSSALEAYVANVDTYANTIQSVFGGTWEGPFADGPLFVMDDEYAVASGKAGRVLRFNHTYEQLIYNQARGVLDDVRLRRQMLKVRPSFEAPGDYGPGGKAVYRLRRVTVSYACSVDKDQSQDLKGIYEATVKPFLLDEAKLAVGTSQFAFTFSDPLLDRAENRIEATVEVLAASNGNMVASTVTTQDEDDAGKYLVAVWNGDPLAKIDYDGPKTLRRTVTQRYTIIGNPAGAKGGSGTQGGAGGKDQFGIFNINQPLAFEITAASDTEANIDAFFGIPSAAKGKGDGDPAFATSGGVPEPRGARAVYRNGVVIIEPITLGRPGEPQIFLTKIVKQKVYEYIHDVARGGGPGKTPSPGGGGGGSSQGGKTATGGSDGPGGAFK